MTQLVDAEELVLEIPQTVGCIHCPRVCLLEERSPEGYCPACYSILKTNEYECESCTNTILPVFVSDDSDETIRPYKACDDCACYCERCEERCSETVTVQTWNSARYRYAEQTVCNACLEAEYCRCNDCHEYVNTDSTTEVNGDTICNACIENYRTCDRCNEWMHADCSYWNEYTEEDLCHSCYRQVESESSSTVHSYSYQPRVKFFDVDGCEESPSGMYHGIELEVGWRIGDWDEYAEQVHSALSDTCYLKEDSSILSANVINGFEIVTHPCKLEYYRSALHRICDGQISGLLSHNAGEGLGLHISVNKDCLTNHAIARICTFIGADRNEGWLVKLARRKSSQWAQIIKKDSIEDTLVVRNGYEYIKTNESRYEAVNLINNSHIEFRLFRGTLKYSSAMLCLEFVNALCRWCMEPAEVTEYQSAQSLLAFARKEPEVYPHLIEFLCESI